MKTEHLVRLADAFSRHCGLTVSTISTYAANDGKFLRILKEGRASCTIRKAGQVLGWFHENWPADLEWPSDIPRPGHTAKEVA